MGLRMNRRLFGRREPQKQKETPSPPSAPPRPKLYFMWNGRQLPYEYEVVGYGQLHPKLRKKVDEIRKWVNVARVTSATWASLPVAYSLGIDPYKLTAPVILANFIPRTMAADYKPKATRGTKGLFNAEDFINKSFISWSFLAPNYPTAVLTKRLGRAIREISENEESPFERRDAAQLLSEFHYGIVDNGGNIILLKHPSLSKNEGWEKIREWTAWHAPLVQRTRFEIQKPPKKVKETKPRVGFVFAPFRLRPATSGA